jgi:hypothetical protein
MIDRYRFLDIRFFVVLAVAVLVFVALLEMMG